MQGQIEMARFVQRVWQMAGKRGKLANTKAGILSQEFS
jgi:hypothetical protein